MRFSRGTLIKVLIFAVVSVIFTVGLGLKIGNLQLFSNDYKLQAVFGNATGIFKGDAVKLAGVDVGRVLGAKLERGKAIVEFAIDKNVKLPKNSLVGLRWRNVLGQRYLYLYPGQASQTVAFTPAVVDQPIGYFKDGDTIPENQTVEAGDLNEFLNTLGPILRAIDPQKANAFLDAVNTALGGNEVVVRQLLNNGGVLASRLGEMDQQIKTFISSADTVVHTYAAQNQSISQILDNLDVIGKSLQSNIGDIDSLIVNLADVQRLLDRMLKQNRGNIDATLRSLNSILGALVSNRRALENTLCT
ncbi:MAG TPA: MlaD family protein, partial [Actinomycetota bacterium]